MALLSVHTWALNRHLGPLRFTRWDAAQRRPVPDVTDRPQTTRLLDLPGRLRQLGFETFELGHFHLPPLEDVSPTVVSSLREACAAADLPLWSLLVDYGDLSSADPLRAQADRAYLEGWVRVASALGARYVRLVAGDGSPDDPAALDRCVAGMRELCDLAETLRVGVLTENFRRLASTAETCNAICDRMGGRVGLCADFGNFPRASRHASLAAVLPRARSVHAKAECDGEGNPIADEFVHCLDLAADAGFSGAYTVVYEGAGDQWAGVEATAALIRGHPRALAV